MASNLIQIILDARNKASKEIQKVDKDLSRLGDAATPAQKGMSGLTKGFIAVGAAATGATLAFTQIIAPLAQLAGEAEIINRSFQRLAAGVGVSGQQMLASMRTASQGMISDTQLMLSANRAMMLGVADTAEEMSALIEIAISRGQAMGLTAEQAFDNLVTGIGRASPQILDNLGIMLDSEKVFNDYAESLGVTADQLTEAGRQQAVFNAIMAEAGDNVMIVDGTVTGFQQLRVAVDNAKVALGNLFGPQLQQAAADFASVIQLIADTLNALGGNVAIPQLNRQTGEFYQNARKDQQLYTADVAKGANSVASLSSEYRDLQSTVTGVLRGMWDSGVDAEQFFPREDAVNENARRLADIAVNGLKGQDWLSEFRSEVPGIWDEIANADDPQKRAQELLRDFQRGLRPELIDKERAKELARQAILGDQNAKKVADEIASELAAEMGVSMYAAQAAASAAVGGTAVGQSPLAGLQRSIASVAGEGGGVTIPIRAKFLDTEETLRARWTALAGNVGARLAVMVGLDPEAGKSTAERLITQLDTWFSNEDNYELAKTFFHFPYEGAELLGRRMREDLIQWLQDPNRQIKLPFTFFSLEGSNGMNLIQGLVAQMKNSLSAENSPLASFATDFTDKMLSGIRTAFTTMETASGENMIGALGSMFQRAFVMSATDNDLGAEVAGNIFSQISASSALIEQSGTGAGQRWRAGFMGEVMGLPRDVLNTLAALLAPMVGEQQRVDHWRSEANPGE